MLAPSPSPRVAGASPEEQIPRLLRRLKEGDNEPDKPHLRLAIRQLLEGCRKDDWVEVAVAHGVAEALRPLLDIIAGPGMSAHTLDDLLKDVCEALYLMSGRRELQTRIVEAGVMESMIRVVREHHEGTMTRPQPCSPGLARRATDTIYRLTNDSRKNKNLVRDLGGIPALVKLLEATDPKVQHAAAGALRSLALNCDENKMPMLDAGVLPALIQLVMRIEDPTVHHEAIGAISNLIHSNQGIKLRALAEGALQPVINILTSPCDDSRKEAALILGQFASTGDDTKAKIAQRGAIPPLVAMLGAESIHVKEMAAFALGRLAQSLDNQAGIVQGGGLGPLLLLLESGHQNLKHNAAFTLYCLSENEDNIPAIVREGALQRIMTCTETLTEQTSKDCLLRMVGRMAAMLGGRVLSHVVHLMNRSSDSVVKRRAATALARLVHASQIPAIFVDKNGLDLLMQMLSESTTDVEYGRFVARSVLVLARKISENTDKGVSVPEQPTKTVYLGAQYVNNPTLADVTFLVEGRLFYSHRIALLASSDAFSAMFKGGYREQDASSIEIPNMAYDVFESMMMYIYTGHVDVIPEQAADLLQASDQYLLGELKRLCEASLCKSICMDNFMDTFELSEAFGAPDLGKQCAIFALEHYSDIVAESGPQYFCEVMMRMVPHLRMMLLQEASKIKVASPQSGTPTTNWEGLALAVIAADIV